MNRSVTLACVESIAPRVEHVMRVTVHGQQVVQEIDPLFFGVCHPWTIEVVGLAPSAPAQVGAVVNGQTVEIAVNGDLPNWIVVKLSGIRADPAGV